MRHFWEQYSPLFVANIMKVLGMLGFCILVGCTGWQTLEELENQATISGDWTEVEKRELSLQRRLKELGAKCPMGLTHVCIEDGSSVSCQCVRPVSSGR